MKSDRTATVNTRRDKKGRLRTRFSQEERHKIRVLPNRRKNEAHGQDKIKKWPTKKASW